MSEAIESTGSPAEITAPRPRYQLFPDGSLSGFGPQVWLDGRFSPAVASGSDYVIHNSGNYYYVYLSGTGLSIDAAGKFISGTITGFSGYYTGEGPSVLHVTATGLDLSATALQAQIDFQDGVRHPIAGLLVPPGGIIEWGAPSSGGMYGGTGGDVLFAGSGDVEFVFAHNGSNIIYAGAGDARIYAGVSDTNRSFYFGEYNPTSYPKPSGFNVVIAESGSHDIFAGDYQCYIDAGTGNNNIYLGKTPRFSFAVTALGDTVVCGTGTDRIHLAWGNDYIVAGTGGTTVEITWDQIYLQTGIDNIANFQYGSGPGATQIELPYFLGPDYGAYLRAYGDDAYVFLGNVNGGYQTIGILGGATHLSEIASQIHYNIGAPFVFDF